MRVKGLWAPSGLLQCVATMLATGCRIGNSMSTSPPPSPGTHAGFYVYPLQAGDTVSIRADTYPGSFRTSLQGLAGLPIQFRQYPRERATIDGSLSAEGSNLYNWGGEGDVAVDVSGVLHDGDAYEVHNVQALFGPAVVTGTYRGGAIRVPMTGTEPPAPLGPLTRTPPRTGPAFDVFLLTRAAR